MSELTREKECWSYVKPAQRSRNGRLAYQGLRGHYLEVNNVDNMSSKAENLLQSTSYTGEKRNWNFEKFARTHIDQHSILESLREHGYAGLDERSKVRHLLAGIKTTMLDSVKTRIMSDATLRSDFDAYVNLCQDFIKQTGTGVREVTIAGVQTHVRTGKSHGKSEADMTVEDRYYSKKEYESLSPAKKFGLKLKREKRGHKEKKEKSGKSKKQMGEMNLSERSIKALASALRQSKEKDDKLESSEGSDEDSQKEPAEKRLRFTNNRNNPALARRK